jgi:hypothetical protein
MEKRKETITSVLGIEEGWFENMKNVAEEQFEENETVSDILERMAVIVKNDEFDMDLDIDSLSVYEKKLIMVGYMSGVLHQGLKAKNQILHTFSKMMGQGED